MQSKNDEYFMNIALKEAQKAFFLEEIPVGCVIVKDNKIIARSHNLKEKTQCSLNHAELLAIKKACKKLNSYILDECTIYVTLEPCAMCTGAILTSRIKRLVYGTNEPKFGSVESITNLLNHELYPYNHIVEVTSGILKEPCSQILKTFFKNIRNKK